MAELERAEDCFRGIFGAGRRPRDAVGERADSASFPKGVLFLQDVGEDTSLPLLWVVGLSGEQVFRTCLTDWKAATSANLPILGVTLGQRLEPSHLAPGRDFVARRTGDRGALCISQSGRWVVVKDTAGQPVGSWTAEDIGAAPVEAWTQIMSRLKAVRH
jgi:hypothetical protein